MSPNATASAASTPISSSSLARAAPLVTPGADSSTVPHTSCQEKVAWRIPLAAATATGEKAWVSAWLVRASTLMIGLVVRRSERLATWSALEKSPTG